jgi:hypothetical protein
MLWIVLDGTSVAQERHPYQTPQSIALATSLQAKFQAGNEKIPLPDLIQHWSVADAVPVWLDRRIPSDANISVSETWTTVGDSMAKVAEQLGADVATIDGVVMIVPQGLAQHLETAYWSLAVSSIPKNWLRVEDKVFSWEDGSISKDVLSAFSARFPLADFQPEQLEYDVWGGAQRGKTTPAVVAISLLGSFDQKPVFQGNRVSVEPIQRHATPERLLWEYRDEIARLGKERWQQWRSRWSDVEVRRTGDGANTGWSILAPVAAHRELVQPLAPPPKKQMASDPSNIRYTGRYRGELQAILRSLAKQRELELELPELPQPVLRQELDLVFEQDTFEEILARISSASGLHVQLLGNRLRVSVP